LRKNSYIKNVTVCGKKGKKSMEHSGKLKLRHGI